MAKSGRPAEPSQPSLGSGTASTARFTLSAESFAFAPLFEQLPDACVECEPVIANPTDHALVVIRTDGNRRSVDAALQADSAIATADCFGERPDGFVCRVTWAGRPRELIQRLIVADVTLLSLWGENGEWKLRVLTPDRDGVSQTADILENVGCEADCQKISPFEGERRRANSEMTCDQRKALTTAFKEGYYAIPREITQDELADELGISHQAVSERLRRAYQELIAAEVIVE